MLDNDRDIIKPPGFSVITEIYKSTNSVATKVGGGGSVKRVLTQSESVTRVEITMTSLTVVKDMRSCCEAKPNFQFMS